MEADKFFIFMLVLDLSAITACSLSFLVSASVRIFAVANVIVSLPTILMMLFGGFLANTLSLLDWLEWIKYISLFRYGINVSSNCMLKRICLRTLFLLPLHDSVYRSMSLEL